MRRAIALFLAAGAAGFGGLALAAPSSAASGDCATTITFSGGALGANLQVNPANPTMKAGGCIAFVNATNPAEQVAITITKGDKKAFGTTLNRGATANGRHGFAPSDTGTYSLSATAAEPLNLEAHGVATITVKPAPSTSPTSSTSPKPHHSKHPVSLPTISPSGSPSHSHTPRPHATGIKLPPLPPLPKNAITAAAPKGSNPLVAPGPTTAAPVTESASPVAAIYNGPIEPADNDSRGLPIAIGVLVFLGVASSWGRALLATATGAVDKASKGRHRT